MYFVLRKFTLFACTDCLWCAHTSASRIEIYNGWWNTEQIFIIFTVFSDIWRKKTVDFIPF